MDSHQLILLGGYELSEPQTFVGPLPPDDCLGAGRDNAARGSIIPVGSDQLGEPHVPSSAWGGGGTGLTQRNVDRPVRDVVVGEDVSGPIRAVEDLSSSFLRCSV